MLKKLAEIFTCVGALSTAVLIALVAIPTLAPIFTAERVFVGTAEFAWASGLGFVFSGLGLFFYAIAPEPRCASDRHIALLSLLVVIALNIFPPLLALVCYLLYRFQTPAAPANRRAVPPYHVSLTYGLAMLGFVMVVSPATPVLRALLSLDQGMNAANALFSGLACTVSALVLAQSVGLARVRGAVLIAATALALWAIIPFLHRV